MRPLPILVLAGALPWLAARGTGAADGARVRVLEPCHCATLVFTGPFERIGVAYDALIGAMKAEGRPPSGEFRQMLLYYEREQSPNNRMLIQIGLP